MGFLLFVIGNDTMYVSRKQSTQTRTIFQPTKSDVILIFKSASTIKHFNNKFKIMIDAICTLFIEYFLRRITFYLCF
jgi:hypothetical protein